MLSGVDMDMVSPHVAKPAQPSVLTTCAARLQHYGPRFLQCVYLHGEILARFRQ